VTSDPERFQRQRPALDIKPVLDKVPSCDRAEVMTYLEQQAILEGDLALLRSVKDYRRMVRER